ncbi:inner nuclear membrane protein enriched at telomere/subtelomere region [Spiromyces aspiralis]|uniref:Inner nuclear membrane protein enriched at telomere/subtelomere region n=1 Tax=Spiromyces aspiralis TaxID=68401 RepID=A0ACC1HDL0_9FUNG|nr:inner nuclear membrane protein enriched at telomere/subtelomere region [Spiromyces aspiralis]
MWGRAGYRLGKEEFDQLFDQAIALIEQLDERQVEPFIITEEDDDESSAEVLSTSDERSLYYVADMAQYPLACRVRRAVLSQLISNIHWVGVGLVGLVMASVGRRRLETIRAEKRAADALVLTAIRRLRDQATKHYLDPVLYPSPAISSNQLRDLLLLNSPSPASSASMTPSEDGRAGGGGDSGMLRLSFFDPRVRQRVWEHVKKVVERNTNVRCRTMAIKGELMRTWEWIGPLDIAGPNATAPVGPPLVLEPED